MRKSGCSSSWVRNLFHRWRGIVTGRCEIVDRAIIDVKGTDVLGRTVRIGELQMALQRHCRNLRELSHRPMHGTRARVHSSRPAIRRIPMKAASM